MPGIGDTANEAREGAPLRGRVVLITGASRGIGRATAAALGAAGATVGLVGRVREALEATAAQVRDGGGRAEVLVADLGVRDDLQRLPEQVRVTCGRLDVLIHGAGLYQTGPSGLADLEVDRRVWEINTHAPLALSLGCAELLRASRGEIVFINSSVVASAAPEAAAYAASKRALAAVADSLRSRFNEHGIRVLSVYPGRTATPMQRQVFELEGRPYPPELLIQPEDVASLVLHALSLPRTAEVTDIHVRPFRKL